MSNIYNPNGGCLKCKKCEKVRSAYFCGHTKLTNKQLYNTKGYCSEFVPKKMEVEHDQSEDTRKSD